ncbi:MAG: Ribosomal large subunit pseudouridine synthase B [Ignavibacteriae bacterium]|nr:MAG: Ribosomal large subunit pseudouridine synthase B [Ignavibacteriota bacterium]
MKTRNNLNQLVRLNKYIADCGISSRRKADELIINGRVEVNGKVCTELGTKINPRKDKIFVDGKQVVQLDEPVYIVLNKPKDCITTTKDEKGRTTVLDYVRVKQRIFPVGRLDRDTTGVLLLTNDGEFANLLMHPRYEIQKSYKVTLEEPIKPEDIQKLARGIKLSDGITQPAEVYVIPKSKNKEVGIIIHEGRNRQVRRMFESLGYTIKKLDRISYGPITTEGLKRGQWRFLTKKEIENFKKLFEGESQ